MISAPVPFGMEDGEYMITIEPKKKKRSLDQNRYFWALVGEIAKKENGDLKDVDDLYTNLLMMSGAKYETVIIRHEALDRFKSLVKHVKVMDQRIVNHELYDTVYAFYGSSTFNTSEMADLIDTTLKYASEVGVEGVNDYWKGLLND